MNYLISTRVFQQDLENLGKMDKTGKPAEPIYSMNQAYTIGFNLNAGITGGTSIPGAKGLTGFTDLTFTASEVKSKVKEKLGLPDNIIDVKLISMGKEISDENPILKESLTYTATIPYAPKTATGSTGATGATGSAN